MAAYIIRRILLMIPTLLGIMLVSFVVVQFAPGGPVEKVIAQISGSDTGATSRISGSPGGDFGGRGQMQAPAGGDGHVEISRRAGPRSGIHQEPGKAVRLRQAGLRALLPDAVELHHASISARAISATSACCSSIKEKLPVSMSLGIWMTLITYLISIPLGIRKAVADGTPLRHLDVGRHHHRLCHPGISVCDPADHPVRGRLVLEFLPAARPDLGQLGASLPWYAQDPRLFLASGAADHLDGARRLRHHDAADQELVPRRNPQAIRADRARQGLHRDARCSTATSSATRC